MKILNIMLSRDLGGIQQSFLDYGKMLKMAGINVVNISSLGAEINNSIQPNYRLMNLGSWDIFSSMQLKSIINKEAPDAIIAHGGRATKFAVAARSQSSIPLIGIIHSDKLKWVDKCDHIIALTNAMKKKAIELGVPKSKLSLLPNTIDLATCNIKKRDEENILPIIGTMARFVQKKGIEVFLESLALLKKEGIQFKAIIGGGGEEEQNYKSLSKELGLNHYVEFVGWVKDKSNFFNRLDIFCLPSLNEPFGIILLESMAHKIPVISTKTAGPLEILTDKIDGILVDTGSAEQIAESIKILLGDELLSKQLSSNALLTVKQSYDISVVSKKLASILNNIIKKS